MATQSVRIGWRPYVTAQQLQTANLLDSYSGAAAAYSLRKLKSSYTGSAIRVRRSSDNTELNIGFDSDGNLDTVTLSVFVGSGNGFVSIWYDQSGNGNNAAQTTAANQPQIVSAGSVITMSNKPSVKFTTSNMSFTQIAGVSGLDIFVVSNFTDVTGGGQNWNIMSPILAETGGNAQDFVLGAKGSKMAIWAENNNSIFLQTTATISINTPYIYNGYGSSTSVGVGFNDGNYVTGTGRRNDLIVRALGKNSTSMQFYGNLSEVVVYNSLQTANRSGINTNLNTYYSVYPNPSSVWNLLTAAYNADTVGSSSLKTSLFAAYNGESNTNDSFGSNNGTAVGGLTYTAGKIGNAFTFNGSNSYVSLPNNSLNPSGDFTISLWVKFNSVAATYINLIENYYNPSFNSRYGFNMYLQSGKIRFATYDGSITNIAQSTTTFVVNQWYQIILSKKINTAPKLYVNGLNETFTQVGGNISNNIVYNSLCKSLFGVDFDYSVSYNSYLNGSLDAINIWNKELTASEVSELYNSGNGAQYIGDNFYKPTTNNALNTNNGTAVGGLTYGLGKVGTAFVGNGTNAYVQLPDNSLNLTSPFSYSFWIKSSDTAGYTVIVGNIQSTRAPYGFAHGYQFWLQYNKISIGFRDGMDSTNYGLDSVANVANGSWNHVVITYKYTINNTNGIKIYINGSLDSSRNAPNSTNFYSLPMKPAIMARNTSGSYEYPLSSGSMLDEMNIWNKELSPAEVTELYNSGNGKQYPN
jgi:hypothetical protein